MRHKIILLFFIIVVGFGMATAKPIFVQSKASSLPPIPKVWQIVWSNDVSVSHLQDLKNMGYDGLFKCVAYAPAYPNSPIFAGGEWRLVERNEGEYDWSSLQTCLNSALQTNMWFIPEIVLNIPPEWFIQRYPDSLLKDSRGITATDPDSTGAPYLLSPWFVSSGAADSYLQPFISSFLSLVSQYPNVPAVMIGNFKLNVLPWKMGTNDSDDFTYWPIWDNYAKASYETRFGTGELPPSTWNEYQTMNEFKKTDFRGWLTSAIEANLQDRYLPWFSSFDGWKVINASIWNNNDDRGSIFTTMTPEMATSKQIAIASAEVSGVIINDDNMGDCGLEQYQQQDVVLAHSNGFMIFGERVPGTCNWASMFAMWQNFDPLPDGFINIGDTDIYWIEQFRMLYGVATEPLLEQFLPVVIR